MNYNNESTKKSIVIKIATMMLFLLIPLFTTTAVSDEAKSFIELIRQSDALFTLPIEQFRPAWDAFGSSMPDVPKRIEIEEEEINGVPGEWVISPNADDDKVLLHFHGGGFSIGSPSFYRQMNYRLSKAAKVTVFSVDYRLAPEHPYPAGVEDCIAVYEGLLKDGYEPEDIAFSGDSAGGGIVFQALLLIRERGLPMPVAAVAISPWVNLTNTGFTVYKNATDVNPNGTDPMTSLFNLHRMSIWYLKGTDPLNPNGMNANDPLVSPVFADLTDFPPVYLTASNIETLYGDSLLLLDKLSEADVNTTFEIGVGLPHVWPAFAYAYPEGQETINRIGQFLKGKFKD